MKAVEVLMESGVPQDKILFINLVRTPSFWGHAFITFQISCPEGLKNFCTTYPQVRVVRFLRMFHVSPIDPVIDYRLGGLASR